MTIADAVGLVELGTAIDARRRSAPPATGYRQWPTAPDATDHGQMADDPISVSPWDERWTLLLDAWSPPHRASDHVTPLLWHLLRAAQAQPALRARYPGRSVNTLVMGDGPNWWRQPVASRWPRITAQQQAYSITTAGRVVFESPDPAEAAARLAHLITEHGADTHNWPQEGQVTPTGRG